MKTLYIIGNGFDCYCHGMKTKYKDFRDYLLKKYPGSKKYYGFPYPTLTFDHYDYDYAEENVVAYIVHVLDTCQGEDWSDLETALGREIYNVFEDEFEDVDMDDDDNDIFNAIEQNRENGSVIAEIFDTVKKLFFDWINDVLAKISYNKVGCKSHYSMVLRKNMTDSFYINFNYTYTLECVYGIAWDQVWHIHGQVGDSYDKILFGHGNNEISFDSEFHWGAEDHFDELAESLKKDTGKVIHQNKDKFTQLSDIEEIYSVGFSFSEVDMVYIQELCQYIDPKSVKWYFDTYDSENNKTYMDRVRELGFQTEIESRW